MRDQKHKYRQRGYSTKGDWNRWKRVYNRDLKKLEAA